MGLLVLIHGTERGHARYRDAFAEFAEEHHCLVLAPLFPGGIIARGDLHNYKFIDYHGVEARLDLVPGAAHEADKMFPIVQEFFADALTGST